MVEDAAELARNADIISVLAEISRLLVLGRLPEAVTGLPLVTSLLHAARSTSPSGARE
ncbi:hypothetical protein [Lentzea sp. NPDC059081]|uniref:hypothetical protein n=1 Tax=Lentzea sp. NPDC059081 TaxID=3346719 RepID=UPI0036743DA9